MLGLHRSNLYYEPVLEEGQETEENLTLMRLLDEQYTETPFYGVRRMTQWLRQQEGYLVNPKRVRRLLRKMGLWAIYPGNVDRGICFLVVLHSNVQPFCE